MNKKQIFPKDFLWGAATASYQVEGGIDTCDWAAAAREDKVPECGRACDHYNRYEEDFDIAKSLGHNAHRFSVEWARIEPEEGRFDENEIEHYRKVLQALRARGLEPFVTLWHFTLPSWFADSGGWQRKDAPEVFAHYCAYVVEQFGDLATRYATMNEPIVYASNGWVRGIWPPFRTFRLVSSAAIIKPKLERGKQGSRSSASLFMYFAVRRALVRAHNAAYVRMKSVSSNCDVSIVKNVIVFDANLNPFHKIRAALLNYHWTHSFMTRVARRCDSIGLNYYFYKKFGDSTTYEKTDMNWDIAADKIGDALRMLWRYNKPLFVAEAGLADARDTRRAEYIRATVHGIESALEQGVQVVACMYWSLLDNYEWAAGFGERFGLVDINYDTLKRTIRPSAYIYKEIIDPSRRDAQGFE